MALTPTQVRNRLLKEILLDMAKHNEPQPSPNTILGKALKSFTTKEK